MCFWERRPAASNTASAFRCCCCGPKRDPPQMRPIDIQPIGQELAIKWDDGSESFVSLEKLRRSCPCAGCKGEMDVMGNLYKNPDRRYTPQAFQLIRLGSVGGYAVQPLWADGHQS